jgi:hypothetical protein
LAFPDLFEAKQFQGEGSFNYSATFLIEPGSVNDKTIRAAIQKAAETGWLKKAAETLESIKTQSMKYAYVDGNTKNYDGYQGKWALSAKRPKDSGPPKVVDLDPSVTIGAEEGRVYGGCYVNAKVQLWAQVKGKGAPGMRCSLVSVQFKADGDSFGGAPVSNTEGFEVEEDDGGDLT